MGLLTLAEVIALKEKAIAHGLDKRRDEMLAELPPEFVAGLETVGTPRGQLSIDISALNAVPRIVGGITPLAYWLLNAKFQSAAFPDRQSYYGELAETVLRRAAAADPAGHDPVAAGAQLPERILFRNDLLPAAFLTGAARTSRAVARMVVPQIDGTTPRTGASAGEPVSGYGTGWLIGARFVITNWHVIEARAPTEAAPTPDEIARQCAGARAEFDFDGNDIAPVPIAVAALARGDPRLDYAVLRLAADPGRAPLPLRAAPLVFDPADSFAVNVVQHPGGAAKQFGIRNNLVAALDGIDLAYYTDTAGGSSGSPVCDDRWQVVALHKASSLKFGPTNFQGKDTAWVNVGTPIALIVDHLRQDAALWTEIAAALA